MDILIKVCVLLACTVIAAGNFAAFNLFKKRDDSGQNSCHDELEKCFSQLSQEYPFFRGQDHNIRPLIDDIDRVCEYFNTASNCIEPHRDLCTDEHSRQGLDVVLAVGGYVCSDYGRSLLSTYKENSRCYHNHGIMHRMIGFVRSCSHQIRHSPDNQGGSNWQCRLASELPDCLSRRVTRLCGEAAAELVRTGAERGFEAAMGDRCNRKSTYEDAEMVGETY